MPATKKLEVTITDEQEREMRRLVESGDYASTDQIIDIALGAIGIGVVEVSDEVLKAALDEVFDNPQPLLTPEEVHKSLLDHHEAHLRKLRVGRS